MHYIDLLPLVLLILFLTGIKPIENCAAINKNYLSLDTGCNLRGLFAIVVVFHHLSQGSDSGFVFQIFKSLGYLAVAVFFFLSGYGLQRSYITSENYKKHFLQKRLTKILIPYFIVAILCWIARTATGNIFIAKDLIESIKTGQTFVPKSWYIICICYFYVAFWIFMRLLNNKYNMMILCSGIWFVLYFFICRHLNYGIWWYSTAHLLVVGIFWATYEQKILSAAQNHDRIIFPLSILSFLVVFIVKQYVGSQLSTLLTMLDSVLFVLSLLLLTLKTKLESYVFRFLGNISLEIYLIHGLVMLAFRSDFIYIENDFLWCLITLSGSILSSWILHQFVSGFSKLLVIRSRQ